MEVRFFEPYEVEDHLFKFAVILARSGGKWVLCRHRDRTTWENPGGHREPGETMEETARRELLEETGFTANSLELVGVYTGPEEHAVYPNGDEVYNVEFFFVCRDWSGTLKCQEDEVEELRFFHPDEFPPGLSGGAAATAPGLGEVQAVPERLSRFLPQSYSWDKPHRMDHQG